VTPLTTVIVPNYNHAISLSRCLAAIRAQTYAPIEIVVVDDCSTDDSVRVARGCGAVVISTPVNGGAAVARNLGASMAKGEFLFFVDSDGALAPDAVATAVAMLEADPGLGAVCGIDDAEPLVSHSRVEDYRALQHHYWSIVSQGEVTYVLSAMFAIRSSVFAETGPFDVRLRYTEEVEYGQRLSTRYHILSTAAIHGRLDHDETLWPLVRKIFHRARLRVPLYARRRRFVRGYETPARSFSALTALLAVAALPLVPLLGPPALALAGLALAASLALDAGMSRFVLARRGPLFTLYFAGVHFVVKVATGAGVLVGAAQWLLSPAFRGTYDRTWSPQP
jgi:glycosyltransferase involved in cell wall biosynthesis